MCDDTPNASSYVSTLYGPFEQKAAARAFADQFNEENDGSPWRALIRPMSLVRACERHL
jgi:hypothetical protein